jgi:hypothetical protein
VPTLPSVVVDVAVGIRIERTGVSICCSRLRCEGRRGYLVAVRIDVCVSVIVRRAVMILSVQDLLCRRMMGVRVPVPMRVAISVGMGMTVAITALCCCRAHSGRICVSCGKDPS